MVSSFQSLTLPKVPESNIIVNIKDDIIFLEIVLSLTKPMQERNYYYFVYL